MGQKQRDAREKFLSKCNIEKFINILVGSLPKQDQLKAKQEIYDNPRKAFEYAGGGFMYPFLQDPTEEDKFAVVKSCCFLLKYIDDQSDELKKFALDCSPYSIEFIENPTIEQERNAISRSPFVIGRCENPTDEIVKLAEEVSKEKWCAPMFYNKRLIQIGNHYEWVSIIEYYERKYHGKSSRDYFS